MDNDQESNRSRVARWGWGILLAVSALLALNGVALYFISASPATFEQDTGVPMTEVREAFPTVVDHVVREGRAISMMLASLGLLVLVVALEGFRRSSRWAWNAIWIFVGMLAVISIEFIVVGGRFDIGVFYLIMAAATLVGQLLARRGLAS